MASRSRSCGSPSRGARRAGDRADPDFGLSDPGETAGEFRLATGKIEKAYAISLRPWPEAIAEIVATLES